MEYSTINLNYFQEPIYDNQIKKKDTSRHEIMKL